MFSFIGIYVLPKCHIINVSWLLFRVKFGIDFSNFIKSIRKKDNFLPNIFFPYKYRASFIVIEIFWSWLFKNFVFLRVSLVRVLFLVGFILVMNPWIRIIKIRFCVLRQFAWYGYGCRWFIWYGSHIVVIGSFGMV